MSQSDVKDLRKYLGELCFDFGCYVHPLQKAAWYRDPLTGEKPFTEPMASGIDAKLAHAREHSYADLIEAAQSVAMDAGWTCSGAGVLPPAGWRPAGQRWQLVRVWRPVDMSAASVRRFWLELVELGVALHPDTQAAEIVMGECMDQFFSDLEARLVDEVVDSAFAEHGEGVYDIATEAWRIAGIAPSPPDHDECACVLDP